MSSDIRRLLYNTRERLLSTDFNESTDHTHRAVIEQLNAVLNEAFYSAGVERSGVIAGMEVSVVPASLTVSVGAGLALKRGTAPTTRDSDMEWIELRTAQTVNLAAHVDGANPRWVAIEIAANDAVETSAFRDQFNPATGTFSSVAVDKVRGSSPTLSVRAGTAAPAPVFPAGGAGTIPLAYVYIPAAAATLTAGDTVGCRPLLTARTREGTHFNGGGVNCDNGGSTVSPHAFAVKPSGAPFTMRLNLGGSIDLDVAGDPMWETGDSYPATTQPIYLYAAIPPYPAGYDSDISIREFQPGSNIVPGSRIPSVTTSGMSNCIVVASNDPPLVGTGSFDGTSTISGLNDATWGGGASIAAYYIGSVSFFAGIGLQGQRYTGGGEVFFTNYNAFEEDIRNASNLFNQTGNFRNELPLTAAGAQYLPDTAIAALLRVAAGAAAVNQDYRVFLSRTGQMPSVAWDVLAAGGNQSNLGVDAWFEHEDGDFDWTHTEATANNHTLTVAIKGYKDAILGIR